ncbi:hypothetical protein ACFXTO_043837 [Malus domestica]
MSSPVPDNVFVSQLFRFVLSWYDAVLAVSLACAIVHPVFNFTFTSSSISKLCDAPAIKVSNLRSILPLDQSDKLVVVRGTVEAKFAVDSTWTSLKSGVLISKETNHRAVVVDNTKMCLVQEWKGLIG